MHLKPSADVPGYTAAAKRSCCLLQSLMLCPHAACMYHPCLLPDMVTPASIQPTHGSAVTGAAPRSGCLTLQCQACCCGGPCAQLHASPTLPPQLQLLWLMLKANLAAGHPPHWTSQVPCWAGRGAGHLLHPGWRAGAAAPMLTWCWCSLLGGYEQTRPSLVLSCCWTTIPIRTPYCTPIVHTAALLLHSELHPGDIHLDLVGLDDIGPLE
jgi:hypothetical protein